MSDSAPGCDAHAIHHEYPILMMYVNYQLTLKEIRWMLCTTDINLLNSALSVRIIILHAGIGPELLLPELEAG